MCVPSRCPGVCVCVCRAYNIRLSYITYTKTFNVRYIQLVISSSFAFSLLLSVAVCLCYVSGFACFCNNICYHHPHNTKTIYLNAARVRLRVSVWWCGGSRYWHIIYIITYICFVYVRVCAGVRANVVFAYARTTSACICSVMYSRRCFLFCVQRPFYFLYSGSPSSNTALPLRAPISLCLCCSCCRRRRHRRRCCL